jgi:hypothetical protein
LLWTGADKLTGKTGNNGDKCCCLGQESPWLNDDSEEAQENCTSLHGNVFREETCQIHAGSVVVLRDIDKDLMTEQSQASKEGCGAARRGVFRFLHILEQHEGIPHQCSVNLVGRAGNQNAHQCRQSNGEWQSSGYANNMRVLLLGESSPIREAIGRSSVRTTDGGDTLNEAERSICGGDGNDRTDEVTRGATVLCYGPAEQAEDCGDCGEECGCEERLQFVRLNIHYNWDVDYHIDEEADQILRRGSGATGVLESYLCERSHGYVLTSRGECLPCL